MQCSVELNIFSKDACIWVTATQNRNVENELKVDASKLRLKFSSMFNKVSWMPFTIQSLGWMFEFDCTI